jgi:ATP-binding cassette subfamily B multidrug efflux pump
MQALRRILEYLKPYAKISALALLLTVGGVAMDLTIPRLTQRVIDQGIAQNNLRVVWSTALLMVGAAIVGALLTVANTLISVRVTQRLAADLRGALYRKIQAFSFSNLDRFQTGQLLVRLTSDVSQVQRIVMMALRILTRWPLMMVGSLVLLVITSPRLASIMLLLLPATTLVIYLATVRVRPLFSQIQLKLDGLNQTLQENLAGVRVVKAFVRTAHENERFDRANRDLTDQTIDVMRLLALLLPTMMLLLNLGVAFAVWFGGYQVIEGDFTLGELVAAINYLLSTMTPLTLLSRTVGQLSAAEASAQRILEVLDSESAVQNRPQAHSLPALKGQVSFSDVAFSYDGHGQEPVLKHINLVAEPGQTVAILGATGAGKSSLVHLIPRFYDVLEGQVTVDGRDVRDVTMESLRTQMGIALQEAVLFSGTVRDNIRYGRPDATDAEVAAAAQAAQAHDFIVALPDGYDTSLGQRGVNLSGGQKQRLAIARALLVQPPILILDDSTSAVDVATEAEIHAGLERLMKDHQFTTTRFIIAQRISTVLGADKIVVLDKGRIVAEGTHAELMVTSPIYQEIYASQLGDGRSALVTVETDMALEREAQDD